MLDSDVFLCFVWKVIRCGWRLSHCWSRVYQRHSCRVVLKTPALPTVYHGLDFSAPSGDPMQKTASVEKLGSMIDQGREVI